MVFGDTDGSAGGTAVALNAKPAWPNNLTPKGLPVKAQAAIKKDRGALTRAGVFKPPKKAVKLDLSAKAVVVKSLKKACSTSNKEGSVFANVPGRRFTLTWWRCYLDSCATYQSFSVEEFLNDSYNTGTVLTNTKGWYWGL